MGLLGPAVVLQLQAPYQHVFGEGPLRVIQPAGSDSGLMQPKGLDPYCLQPDHAAWLVRCKISRMKTTNAMKMAMVMTTTIATMATTTAMSMKMNMSMNMGMDMGDDDEGHEDEYDDWCDEDWRLTIDGLVQF